MVSPDWPSVTHFKLDVTTALSVQSQKPAVPSASHQKLITLWDLQGKVTPSRSQTRKPPLHQEIGEAGLFSLEDPYYLSCTGFLPVFMSRIFLYILRRVCCTRTFKNRKTDTKNNPAGYCHNISDYLVRLRINDNFHCQIHKKTFSIFRTVLNTFELTYDKFMLLVQ